ncbi:MAG TPA: HEAT repeat domain-containing protein [Candidatus Brocadiia bacterium]|nr:HEAT repeat domain-containing protein [Candidatus Brocadiia bacterium]
MQEPQRDDKVEKIWEATYLLMFVAALACIGLGFLALKQLSKSAMLIDMLKGGASATEVLQNLSSDDEYMVVKTLQTLGEKGDASGAESAHYLLFSEKETIWFNAALYLATSGDDTSVPFLIKGLDRAVGDEKARAIQSLKSLTGEDFGPDRGKWIQWWNKTNPDSDFDFGMSEAPSAAAQQDDGSFIVQEIAGPGTIVCGTTAVSIAGVRPRAGDDLQKASEFLAMLLMNQPVRLRLGGMEPDGSRSALVYWAGEDATTAPGADSPIALPLPIRKRQLVNAYLVAAGIFEPAPDAVRDEAFRSILDAEMKRAAQPESQQPK